MCAVILITITTANNFFLGWCARLFLIAIIITTVFVGWRARLFLITITNTNSFCFRVACAVIFNYYDYYEYFCSGGVRGYFKSRLLRRVVFSAGVRGYF